MSCFYRPFKGPGPASGHIAPVEQPFQAPPQLGDECGILAHAMSRFSP